MRPEHCRTKRGMKDFEGTSKKKKKKTKRKKERKKKKKKEKQGKQGKKKKNKKTRKQENKKQEKTRKNKKKQEKREFPPFTMSFPEDKVSSNSMFPLAVSSFVAGKIFIFHVYFLFSVVFVC